MILKAKLPILYCSKQYGVGDTLPAVDVKLVNAWLESGAAFWECDTVAQNEAPKARLVTAEPGLPGKSSDGDPDALVGKVTKTPQRKRTAKK